MTSKDHSPLKAALFHALSGLGGTGGGIGIGLLSKYLPWHHSNGAVNYDGPIVAFSAACLLAGVACWDDELLKHKTAIAGIFAGAALGLGMANGAFDVKPSDVVYNEPAEYTLSQK